MLAYRFVHIDLAAFARDEPQFLAAAREQVRTGHWLAANPLFGNLGARYGPTAFWFYGIVQRFFGDDPRTAIVAMGLVVTRAPGLRRGADPRSSTRGRLLRRPRRLDGVVALPVHWSRLAWDLTSLAGVFAAAALLVPQPGGFLPARASAALGVVLGLGLSRRIRCWHRSPSPSSSWSPGSCARRPGACWRSLGAMSAAGVAVLLPYLLYLLRARVLSRAPFQRLLGLGRRRPARSWTRR